MFLLSDALQKLIGVKGRKTGPLSCHVHPLHVQFWSEQSYFTIHTSVRFHALVQFLGVVEDLKVVKVTL